MGPDRTRFGEHPTNLPFPHRCTGFLYLMLEAGSMKNTKEGRCSGPEARVHGGKKGVACGLHFLVTEVPLSRRSGP